MCAIPAMGATSKERSGVGFFFLSMLISPVLAFIIVCCLSNKKHERIEAAHRRAEEQARREHLELLQAIALRSATPERDDLQSRMAAHKANRS